MKKIGLILAMFAIGSFMIIGNANAALIGIKLDFPDVFSNTSGVYSYVAGTKVMSFNATPRTITFSNGDVALITGGSYSANFLVDNAGNFLGGVPGDDLVITGNFTYNSTNYSGTLLKGEVTNFGWAAGTYAQFDYLFDITGSSNDLFAIGGIGGDVSMAELSNFTGNWQVDHFGTKVKHDTTSTAVPEPTSMVLLGMGILGLFGLGKRKA